MGSTRWIGRRGVFICLVVDDGQHLRRVKGVGQGVVLGRVADNREDLGRAEGFGGLRHAGQVACVERGFGQRVDDVEDLRSTERFGVEGVERRRVIERLGVEVCLGV